MHRASRFRSRSMYVYLVPLAVVLILGLIFVGSGLGRSSNATLTFASTPDVTSAGVNGAIGSTGAPSVDATATGAPSAKPARTGKSTATSTIKAKKPKPKQVKATSKPTTSTRSAPSTSSAPATTKPASSTTTAPAATGGFAQQVLALANTARKDNGCNTPLKLNTKLNTAAQRHSDDMVAKNFFSHTGSDGSDPFERMTDAGYRFSGAAENIAAGGTTAAGAMDQWMNSPGHKANILNCGLVDLGVGFTKGVKDDYAGYWVQDFGSPL
jgi:uncharacterized protein YkwD